MDLEKTLRDMKVDFVVGDVNKNQYDLVALPKSTNQYHSMIMALSLDGYTYDGETRYAEYWVKSEDDKLFLLMLDQEQYREIVSKYNTIYIDPNFEDLLNSFKKVYAK